MPKTIKKKVVIIGVGNMGMAHLKSFLKLNKFFLFLVEKNYIQQKKIIKFLKKNKFHNFTLTKYIPLKREFDFAIIATDPKDRFLVMSKLIKENKVKYLLLEKFLFNNKDDYKKTQKIIKDKGVKIFVNIWSQVLLDRIKLKIPKNEKIHLKVNLTKSSIITNLIHFYCLFNKITMARKAFLNFKKFKINNSMNYTNGSGIISIWDDKGNSLVLEDNIKKSNFFSIEYEIYGKNKKIIFLNGKVYDEKMRKICDFPLASLITSKFFLGLKKKKNSINLPTFRDIMPKSLDILNSFRRYFKREVNIK